MSIAADPHVFYVQVNQQIRHTQRIWFEYKLICIRALK
jgi:hypothetical protein